MLEVRDRHAGSVVALMEVPAEEIHRYGCAAVEPVGEEGVVRVTGLVEKPSRRTRRAATRCSGGTFSIRPSSASWSAPRRAGEARSN
ncbi:hypothetical protein GCM10027072_27010 [Streptomyces bullii]